MKKKYILLSLTVLAGLSLAGCSMLANRKSQQSSSSSSSSKVSLKDSSSSSSSRKRDRKPEKTAGTQRVGSDDYGYITIPDNWIKFFDANGGDDIQYTDGSAYNIVTLNAFTKEKANVPANEELTAEDIANRMASYWNEYEQTASLKGAKTTVAGNEAFQLQVTLKSSQHVTVWIFKSGEKVYIVSFEGNRETTLEFVDYIENTWSLQKDGSSSNI